ncbi:MAG: hypothetical protein HY043_18860 [Verrucomicrobia bacterium]|nr:hypothetical protein [Verrucomicrobiota bacterium]
MSNWPPNWPRPLRALEINVFNAERIFFNRPALREGSTIEEIFSLTKIDRWFPLPIKVTVRIKEKLVAASCPLFHGNFSSGGLETTERCQRQRTGRVDGDWECAAEFGRDDYQRVIANQ